MPGCRAGTVNSPNFLRAPLSVVTLRLLTPSRAPPFDGIKAVRLIFLTPTSKNPYSVFTCYRTPIYGAYMSITEIAGYTYGEPDVARSPVTTEDLELLKRSVLFTEEDQRYLRMAGEVLEDQVEDVLDVWYGFVASHDHLVSYFAASDGQPDAEYLARVRARFGQWIRDLCGRPWDRNWLDYQEEIALRHTPAKKNKTDNAQAVDHVPLRYLIAFIYPITATVRDFLAKRGHAAEDVERMHQAWFKAVTLTVVLWSRPYAGDEW
jgi:Protoglobin